MTAPRQCVHCLEPLLDDDSPPSDMTWCSDACLAAWEAEDPSRTEGWIKLANLTPEKVKEIFAGSGLDVASGAGKVVSS